MELFKFIKRYIEFNKLLRELQRLQRISSKNKEKYERSAANNSNTLSAYYRKKAEYHKGSSETYTNILKMLDSFVKTGDILEIDDDSEK